MSATKVSAFEQPPTYPKRQQLAHLEQAALWQNLAESGLSPYWSLGVESCHSSQQ
jgi:hypothetical protein